MGLTSSSQKIIPDRIEFYSTAGQCGLAGDVIWALLKLHYRSEYHCYWLPDALPWRPTRALLYNEINKLISPLSEPLSSMYKALSTGDSALGNGF